MMYTMRRARPAAGCARTGAGDGIRAGAGLSAASCASRSAAMAMARSASTAPYSRVGASEAAARGDGRSGGVRSLVEQAVNGVPVGR